MYTTGIIFSLYFIALWCLIKLNFIYEIVVTVDTVHILYIHITTEHHTSQYPS